MRKLARVLLFTAAISVAIPPGTSAQRANGGAVAGELLVKFKPQVSDARRQASLAASTLQVIRHFDALGIDHVRLAEGRDLSDAITAFKTNPDVQFVQPNYIRHMVASTPPNDFYWVNGYLWSMERIQAQPIWQQLVGIEAANVVVASIDTGVDYNHPDLTPNMWRNPGEIPGNGIDDDGNGYVDDVYGIDSVNHDADPMDDHGHGTHTAGIMAAAGNNQIGVAGVHWRAKIIACKFISAADEGTDADAIECLNYLIALKRRGVNLRVTNNSWGDPRNPTAEFPAALQAAFDAAGAANILNVCAAGNQNRNNEQVPFDPASFTSPSIVSVAATDGFDNRSYYSNWGAVSVDLAAPGDQIWSTRASNYTQLTGTSMSSPHVAGAAALMAELHPDFSALAIKSLLVNNVDAIPALSGLVASGGRLNVWRAVDAAALAGTTLRVTGVKRPSSSSFELKWTSVPGASYRVYRASTLSAPFTPLTAVMTAGQGQTMETYTDSSAADPQEFYKVELVP